MASPPSQSDIISENYNADTIRVLRKRLKRKNESSHVFYVKHGNGYSQIVVYADKDDVEEVVMPDNENDDSFHQNDESNHESVEEVTNHLEQAAIQTGSGNERNASEGDSESDPETAPYIANYRSIPRNPDSGDKLDGMKLYSNKKLEFVVEVSWYGFCICL